MNWGPDLWDSYNSVVGHVTKGTNDLVDVYAKFIKEKAELEKEYAKGLRKLIAKYEPKKPKENEEPTESSSFRTLLVETGYQAGQHELLAEHVTKVIVKEIQNKSAVVHKKVKDNSKNAKKEKETMDTSYFKLEKAKLKYQKSFHDWKESERNYQIADQDGKLSRNEILKMKHQTQAKQKQYEDSRAEYIDRLDKTNVEQREYFDCLLPGVLSSLQKVDRERMEFVRIVLERCLAGEREMVDIVSKCREGVKEAIASINVESDQDIVVERYKTGDLPPIDIQFEEMSLGREKKSSSLTRRMSSSNFSKQREKQNLFQKKRKLQKNIEKHRTEILKGTKEKRALQLMIQTYTKTPDFGDASKFQQELDLVSQRVQKLEQDLTILNRDLDLVESKMSLNMRHSLLASPSRSLLSMDTSKSDSTGDCEDSEEEGNINDIHGYNNEDVNEDIVESLPEINSNNASVNEIESSEDISELNSNRLSDDWDEEFENEYPELPVRRLLALYSYDGAEEGTLSMDVGDEFEIIGADVDGWINVRRSGFIEEGFIPTAFTQPL